MHNQSTRRRDITGQTFHRWTAIERDSAPHSGRTFWWCQCACGTVRSVYLQSLTLGLSKSCGCLQRDEPANYIDGRSTTPEFVVYSRMRQRCENYTCSDYYLYGGMGITVCERWHDFALFMQDMGPRPSSRHSIERRDNSRGYEPGNCYWATLEEQANNKRTNRVITFRGRSLTLAQWSSATGLDRKTITQRLDRSGWSVEQALTTPAVLGQKSGYRQTQ